MQRQLHACNEVQIDSAARYTDEYEIPIQWLTLVASSCPESLEAGVSDHAPESGSASLQARHAVKRTMAIRTLSIGVGIQLQVTRASYCSEPLEVNLPFIRQRCHKLLCVRQGVTGIFTICSSSRPAPAPRSARAQTHSQALLVVFHPGHARGHVRVLIVSLLMTRPLRARESILLSRHNLTSFLSYVTPAAGHPLTHISMCPIQLSSKYHLHVIPSYQPHSIQQRAYPTSSTVVRDKVGFDKTNDMGSYMTESLSFRTVTA